MSGTFEGDLIRPLGMVTANFGKAEYELDSFIERFISVGLVPESWRQWPIGKKLTLLAEAIHALDASVHSQLDSLLVEVRQLLERRNTLIHGCLLAGGRIVSGRSNVPEQITSVEDLNSLAEAIFNWKERLWSYRWRSVEPFLKKLSASHKLPSTTEN